MPTHVFKIFHKRKGINISIENLIALTLVTLFVVCVFLNKQANSSSTRELSTVLGLISVVYIIGLIVSNFFRHEREFGKFKGELVLSNNKIEAENEVFYLNQISKIDLKTGDVRGDFANYVHEFTPRLSNGTNNIIVIKLKSGQILKYNFLQTKFNRLSNAKDILIRYHEQGLIEWLTLLDILRITDYDEIQRFKAEINHS